MPPQTPLSQGSELSTTRTTSRRSTPPSSPKHSPHRSARQVPSDSDTTTTPHPPSIKTKHATSPDARLIFALRCLVLVTIFACYVCNDVIQSWVDVTWHYLRSRAWFTTVYFETWWATACYAVIIPLYPYTLHYLPWMDRYKVDPSVTYLHQTVFGILINAVVYMAPLATLDTFMVKRYHGVDPGQWEVRRRDWIQTTRALPVHPPTVAQLAYEVIGSVIIYDALFFLIHLTLHKSRLLYTWLHAYHHEHDVMHAHVTNQLTVGERIMLVLAANQALKILYSHPMSRAAFVPAFVFLLTDNHSGYDLPWGLQHLVPGRLMGGPRAHHAHHMLGTRYYQPFFTYCDRLLEWWEGRGPRGVKAC